MPTRHCEAIAIAEAISKSRLLRRLRAPRNDGLMDFRNYLEKLRGLSDKNKKIVLWTIVAVLGLVMGIFWVRSAMNKLSDLGNELGKIEFPQIDAPNSSSILETTTPTDQVIF